MNNMWLLNYLSCNTPEQITLLEKNYEGMTRDEQVAWLNMCADTHRLGIIRGVAWTVGFCILGSLAKAVKEEMKYRKAKKNIEEQRQCSEESLKMIGFKS